MHFGGWKGLVEGEVEDDKLGLVYWVVRLGLLLRIVWNLSLRVEDIMAPFIAFWEPVRRPQLAPEADGVSDLSGFALVDL